MIQWLRNLFGGGARAAETVRLRTELQATRARLVAETQSRRMLKGRYDAATTNVSNERHWAAADGLSAASANSSGVRRTLRNRSRFEFDNSGYYGGIVRGYANDLCGTGPTLQVQDDDDAAAEDVEAAWKRWCKAVCLPRKLWTLAQAKTRDGEAFALLVTNPGVPDAVKLDVRPVEADQVTDPYPWPTGTAVAGSGRYDALLWDGIRYDEYANPVSYCILREHPGDRLSVDPWAFDEVAARYVVHWFRADRPGQLRGVPELTASLPVCAYLRRWNLATLAAAETAAEIAAVIKTPAPSGSDPEAVQTDVEPFETMDIERGTIMALPVGTDIGQMNPTQPTAMYESFKRENVAEMARPIHQPVNVATADSSRHNFSSAKLDHYGYRGGIRVERAFADDPVMERIFLAWLDEARLIPGYLGRAQGQDVAAMTRKWGWPGWPSMDKDESKQDTERLNNSTDTLAGILGEWGEDWRDVVRQRGKELKFGEQEGVPPPPAGGAPGMGGDAAPFGGPKRPAADVPAAPDAAPVNGHARHATNGHAPANRLPAAVPAEAAAARVVLLAVGRLLGDAP